MGRGLSKLQMEILKFAAKRPMAHYAELLKSLFGWEPVRHAFTYKEDEFQPGSQRFSKKEIGEKRYCSNMASLSRACVRLERRGLVNILAATISHWSAVKITDAGRLMVDPRASIPESQPLSLSVDTPEQIPEYQPIDLTADSPE